MKYIKLFENKDIDWDDFDDDEDDGSFDDLEDKIKNNDNFLLIVAENQWDGVFKILQKFGYYRTGIMGYKPPLHEYEGMYYLNIFINGLGEKKVSHWVLTPKRLITNNWKDEDTLIIENKDRLG